MNNRLLTMATASIIASLCSCTSSRMVHQELAGQPASLEYLHDSKVSKQVTDLPLCVAMPDVTDHTFKANSRFDKTKSKVVPAIFYNGWYTEFLYTIGKSQIKEDIAVFVRENVADAATRDGLLKADTATADTKLRLTITIDSLGASGPYVSEGYVVYLLIAYSMSQTERAGPGEAYSRFIYELTDDGGTVLTDTVESLLITEPFVQTAGTVQKLRTDFNELLVETLSETFNENIEHIAGAVTNYVETTYPDTFYDRPVVKETAELMEPQAQVVIYRRRKRQKAEEVVLTVNGQGQFTLNPNEYEKLKTSADPFELCADGSCITITPTLAETTYVECDLSKKDERAGIDVVKLKVGKFYVEQIDNLTARN
ncbi:hypothetical protein LVD17_04875 [Fulvivirga ulvae]|uniref:hypothetical protein n=1 Tax=Fulvivirga ulvae TaxID=2904245 RepID=UPI001F16CB8C|nr:hypothetical protein [Fulvivirga ulvae]UII33159.1 hypothetical protein LVD17_04875 [Fulvivirga ulvae]